MRGWTRLAKVCSNSRTTNDGYVISAVVLTFSIKINWSLCLFCGVSFLTIIDLFCWAIIVLNYFTVKFMVSTFTGGARSSSKSFKIFEY